MDCSIIICTRGRVERLQKTLRVFAALRVPAGWMVEMIVADNDETGSAEEVVRSTRLDKIDIHYLHHPIPGKSRALNAALAKASGTVLLFTDDDVEPAASWLERMAEPLLERRCAAVAGRIVLAPHLARSWFGVMHRTWLAEVLDPADGKIALVGASMAAQRHRRPSSRDVLHLPHLDWAVRIPARRDNSCGRQWHAVHGHRLCHRRAA